MKKFLSLAAVLALVLSSWQAWGASVPADAASTVSETNLAGYICGLSGVDAITVGGQAYVLTTRYSTTPGAFTAGAWIYQTLSGLGLSTGYQDIYSYPDYSDNVVAELPGLVWPDRVYIVSAHYDSTSSDAQSNAPGSDDNASGTAAVMELARVLSQYHFKSTLRFIGFSGEEQGLRGSADYAADARAAGTDIRGVLNLDMIAYTGGAAEDVDVLYPWSDGGALDQSAKALADSYYDNFVLYSGLEAGRIELHGGDIGGSDHVSFINQGYPAIMAIENTGSEIWDGANPYYHSTNDVFANLDVDFATAVVRGAAATLADAAGAIPTPLTAGDFSGNGVVDYTDYTDLAAAWGSHFGDDNWNPYIDLDSDGQIGMGDYAAFASLYGDPGSLPNPMLIPEPCTLLLTAAGALVLKCRR